MTTQLPRIYTGRRSQDAGPASVMVDGVPLLPRLDLRNHSPDGFQWGYGGSGPAQLALALLADCLGDDEAALVFYQRFKFDVIGRIREDAWAMSDKSIMEWVEKEAERVAFLRRN